MTEKLDPETRVRQLFTPPAILHSEAMDDQLDRLAAFIDSALTEETHLSPECLAFVRAGKRLRAQLLLASSDESCVVSDGNVIRAAAAIEFVHAASLLHDDIVDQCDERRGHPALHRTQGIEAATFAGTHLVHLALSLVADLPELARLRIAEAGQQLARGQFLELMHAGDLTASPEERLAIMRLKTATVFSLACELGSMLAGEDYARSVVRRRFGEAFGVLFQVADDVDDLFASATEQGRAPATDLRCAVMSFPIIFALRTSAKRHVRRLLESSGIPAGAATPLCRELVRSSGALARTVEVATGYALEARDHLAALPATGGSQWMAALVDATMARITRFATGGYERTSEFGTQ